MERVFKTATTRSGNLLTPDVITVTDRFVYWEKRNTYLIGKESKTIPVDKISTIDIHNKGFGTDVTINSNGEGVIYVHDLTISDARELKGLIEDLMSSPKSNSVSNSNVTEKKDTTSQKSTLSENDVLDSAIEHELELELKYKRKDLEREERKKQRQETEELLKSNNRFLYFLKWIWNVLLNKPWKKFAFSLFLIFFGGWLYGSIADKLNLKADEIKFNEEVQRLAELRGKIDSEIELDKIEDADILLVDLTWKSNVNNKYLNERERNESIKWLEIHSKYALRLLDLKYSTKMENNKKIKSIK